MTTARKPTAPALKPAPEPAPEFEVIATTAIPPTVGAGRPRVETVEDRAVSALLARGEGQALKLPVRGDGKAQRRRLSDAARRSHRAVSITTDGTSLYVALRAAAKVVGK
jgi:hypothetical protein